MKTTSPQSENTDINPFSADRPITSPDQDLLDRIGFAESLAYAIEGWKENDSLVIALYGPWGSGKTSLKNMALKSITHSHGNAIEIIEFNPWQWSGQDQLAEAFFKEIGIKLKGNKASNAAHLKKIWDALASYLSLGEYVFDGLRRATIFVLAILALFGFFNTVIPSWMSYLVGGLAAFFASLLTWFKGFAEKLANVFSARVSLEEKSLKERKDELSDILSKSNKSYLVVIDDIDRLPPEQIRFLFQIIKANADFPKLIYLLLFDREIIENSLNFHDTINGNEFLGKIVQVGFDIPHIQRVKLERALFAGLDRLLGDSKVNKRFKKERWNNLFPRALRPFFKTLRDVHRFLATLSFHIGLYRNQDGFEVNPIDLIALEVLRVFTPKTYHGLPDLKTHLTGLSQRGYWGEITQAEKDIIRQTVNSFVSAAPQNHQPAVQELLRELFPPIEWVFGGYNYNTEHQAEWLRDLRVCNPEVFDRYFHLVVPEGDISQGEIDALLADNNRETLVQRYRDWKKRDMLGIALDRLEAYKQEINPAHAFSFITALFDIGDELPPNRGGMFDLAYDIQAVRIIYWYLQGDTDHIRRLDVLKTAMQATTGLYLPILYTSVEDSKKTKEGNPGAFTVTGDDLKELQSICLDKIKLASESGKLQENSKLSYILYRWKEWDEASIVKDWIRKIITTKDGLLALLTSFLQERTVYRTNVSIPQVHWKTDLDGIEQFAELDSVEREVSKLDKTNLTDAERRAVSNFNRAIKRRKEGKPENDRDDLEDNDES